MWFVFGIVPQARGHAETCTGGVNPIQVSVRLLLLDSGCRGHGMVYVFLVLVAVLLDFTQRTQDCGIYHRRGILPLYVLGVHVDNGNMFLEQGMQVTAIDQLNRADSAYSGESLAGKSSTNRCATAPALTTSSRRFLSTLPMVRSAASRMAASVSNRRRMNTR